MVTYQTQDLNAYNAYLDKVDLLLETILAMWKTRGGDEKILTFFEDKFKKVKAGTAQGIVALDGDALVGIAWVERVTDHYGNMVLYGQDEDVGTFLSSQLVEQQILDDMLAELVQFEEPLNYQKGFLQSGLIEYKRQRMGYMYAHHAAPEPVKRDGYTLRPFEETDLEVTGSLSFDAHQISKDYEGYQDMSNRDKRIALEKRAFSGIYGPVNKEASLVLEYQGQVIGYCFVLDVSCWGVDHVPWIFDISLLPEYMGKGLGQYILEHVLFICDKDPYDVVGLSVTQSNTKAIALYEKLNFQTIETFYEYAHVPELMT